MPDEDEKLKAVQQLEERCIVSIESQYGSLLDDEKDLIRMAVGWTVNVLKEERDHEQTGNHNG